MACVYDLYSETYLTVAAALARTDRVSLRRVSMAVWRQDSESALIAGQAMSDAVSGFPMLGRAHLCRMHALEEFGPCACRERKVSRRLGS